MSAIDDMLEELSKLEPLERLQRIRELLKEARRLAPEERIKRIKALEAEQRKALEEATEESDKELEDADEFVRETEEELELALTEREDEKEEESLERKVADAPQIDAEMPTYEQPKREYEVPSGEGTGLYDRLQNAAENLDKLYTQNTWSEADVKLYNESKQEIQKAQEYKLSQEFLKEELGLANDMLHRLQYKR